MSKERNEYQQIKHELIENLELSQQERNLLLRLVEFSEAVDDGDRERADRIADEIRKIAEGGPSDSADEYIHDIYGVNWDGHPRLEDSKINGW